tara:strand:+ start:19951 stop:20544 length:594 start_codon:yes stop_codon:yes gene_type:complete
MTASATYHDLTCVILAGGQSSRMGSDKGLLTIENTSFSKQLINLAKTLTPNVMVSVGKHNEEMYQNIGVVTVLDKVADKGPMGGIVSVLPYIKTNWFLVISVDTPLVTSEMITDLWENKTNFDSVVYSTDNRIHPLVGLYHISTKNKWQMALEQNELKVTKMVNSFAINIVYPSPEVAQKLKNINTPKEYQECINQA